MTDEQRTPAGDASETADAERSADGDDATTDAFEDHRAFEAVATDDERSVHEVTTTPFEATARADLAATDTHRTTVTVTVELPTLDAAVAGDAVADVVVDGWFDTLALRLEDAYGVAEVDPLAEPAVEREGSRVVATFRFGVPSPERAADGAKAIVDYVEGTYVQGVVPGYDYAEPVAGLLHRAHQNAGDGDAQADGSPL